ncbi:MAG: glycosyltransferase family 39 protein [Sphingomonas sp.]|uniref:phospholipid carrier-dependent glycosyltransferase n=1 Tax=Sphingomonas sp. TaxID=28214 RepID=UPI001AD37AA7|nr:phospholipid carrier-dependent glycosyltransferase [Sphingomonas sp.]MBN8808107.1 glycosyltransferase family 39 protein [Sphingomonas sp.]
MPLLRRPLVVALLIGLAAEALFLWGLATPHKLVFDEVHYVPAARQLLALAGPVNTEHPLLAKEIIAAGIALFGDSAFGWRFFSTLAGTGVVMGVFGIVWLTLGRVRPALFASLFALLNFTIYIQARIAMLDGFMAAFLVGGIVAALWAMRGPTAPAVRRRWVVAGVAFGLATACKWAAAPYVAFAIAGFVLLRLRDARVAGRPLASAWSGANQPHWPGLSGPLAVLLLGAVSVTTYFVTFLPAFFYHQDPLTLGQLLPFQQIMYAEQTQVLPHHNYQSTWWSWPLIVRPIWYLYEHADGAMRGILMLGNPVVMWGGLVAVAACALLWRRSGDPKLLLGFGLWTVSYLIWGLTPKSLGFYYYYYLPSIFLCVALAIAFDRATQAGRRYWDEAFTVLAFWIAVYFFPIISAARLSDDQAFLHWMWFSSWP